MKRIKLCKEVFNVEGPLVLKELKTKYRNLVKEWHPDKFQEEAKKEEAEIKSTEIIDAYHFLVSIAPETKEANLEEYKTTITNSKISDFQHKGMLFGVTFTNGVSYEYFGVSEKLYAKFVNSDKQFRFAKRQIFHSFLYRQTQKETAVS